MFRIDEWGHLFNFQTYGPWMRVGIEFCDFFFQSAYFRDIIPLLSFMLQFPVLKIETNSGGGSGLGSGNGLGNLPAPLYRTVVAFEKSILECHFLRDKSPAILRELEEVLQALAKFHDQLDGLIEQTGLKGKQSARVYDVYGWNLSLITNHVELLRQCQRDCGFILDQVFFFLIFCPFHHYLKFLLTELSVDPSREYIAGWVESTQFGALLPASPGGAEFCGRVRQHL